MYSGLQWRNCGYLEGLFCCCSVLMATLGNHVCESINYCRFLSSITWKGAADSATLCIVIGGVNLQADVMDEE